MNLENQFRLKYPCPIYCSLISNQFILVHGLSLVELIIYEKGQKIIQEIKK